MSKKALVPLGLIAAAGVMGSLANGQGNKRDLNPPWDGASWCEV